MAHVRFVARVALPCHASFPPDATRRQQCDLGDHLGTRVHTPTPRLGQANDSVDQVLADEPITNVTLGTVRDLAVHNGSTTTVGNHRGFDAFGNLDPATVDLLFAFTGRPLDRDTGLQNNLHRCYEPANGRWISEDPIGFAAGDANLYRYVLNSPTNYIDPTGLEPKVSAHILKLLSSGKLADIKEAISLLSQFTGKAAVETASKLVATTLGAVYKYYPLAALKCDQAAKLVQNAFAQIGVQAQTIWLHAERGRYLKYDGILFSQDGRHCVVRVGNRIYD